MFESSRDLLLKEMNTSTVYFSLCLAFLLVSEAGWFISNFRVFGGSFREVFWKVLTCFSDSFRTIFRTNFRSKRVNREWSYVGLRNQGISMIPGSEPILLDLEKLFLLSEE
mgnify:CR=1 FL=1